MARTHLERRSQLLERFAAETAKMRSAQRRYFATRSRQAMAESVQHESRVDAILAEIDSATRYAKAENPAQAKMFD